MQIVAQFYFSGVQGETRVTYTLRFAVSKQLVASSLNTWPCVVVSRVEYSGFSEDGRNWHRKCYFWDSAEASRLDCVVSVCLWHTSGKGLDFARDGRAFCLLSQLPGLPWLCSLGHRRVQAVWFWESGSAVTSILHQRALHLLLQHNQRQVGLSRCWSTRRSSCTSPLPGRRRGAEASPGRCPASASRSWGPESGPMRKARPASQGLCALGQLIV